MGFTSFFSPHRRQAELEKADDSAWRIHEKDCNISPQVIDWSASFAYADKQAKPALQQSDFDVNTSIKL